MAVFENMKGISVASGFKLQAEAALDPRLTVQSLAERDELVTGNGAYEGMSVYVKDNKKTYQLQGKTVADWVDITSEAASMSALETEIKNARGDKANLKAKLDDIETNVNGKEPGFTAGDGLSKTTDDDNVTTLDVKIDPTDNALTKSAAGLKVPKGKDYTVTVDTSTTSANASKTYVFKQLNQTIATIDIPKDMVVSGGVVETYTNETAPEDPSKTDGSKLAAGTYIVLTIANKAKDKLYIRADSLIEYVTSGSKEGDPIVVSIDASTHKVTATLSDKGIATAKLADGAITTVKIADLNVTATKLATDAVETTKIKDGAVTKAKLAKEVTDKLSLVVDGTTTKKGIVQLSDEVTDDNTMAATPKAVNTVKDIAHTAASDASTAKSDAAIAKSTATEAKSAADTASAAATTASTTATEAKELATAADGNATTASNTATEAKTIALTAKSTADTAKSTADEAKATADGKVSVVWVEKGGAIPTTATANSLCFKIL